MTRKSNARRPAPASSVPVVAEAASAWQHIGEQTIEALRRDASLQAEELREATTPGEAFGLQAAFAATQLGHVARCGEQWLGLAFDIQRQWLHLVESQVAALLGPWLGEGPRPTTPSMHPLLDPPDDFTPAALLAGTQRAWTEGARVWLEAIGHDLQEATPAH